MGYAIAHALAERGAKVELVSGPVHLQAKQCAGITLHKVCSAREMAQVCFSIFPNVDIAVMTAAVADFTPLQTHAAKVKRGKEEWHLTLTPTQDIAAALGSMKRHGQLLVGFALEDTNEMSNAQQKLHTKNLDMIVLNSLNDAGAGFNVSTNKITIIESGGAIAHYPLKTKKEAAQDIAQCIEQHVRDFGTK
jgi:phosphopantothenoylcysteine decarboxylase/phosphopantothenate--cysteine ligase